jgi:AraC family transcriptional regulator, regulatory protein of adaptative response / methylated-DNA-[protein]-cysteine methyltransferase
MTMRTKGFEMTDDQKWQAVLTRDGLAAGRFVYAVASTGVYCRPGCPSRRPRRDNVQFFSLPEQAAQAGYRACKRCHPERQAASDPELARVREVCTFIQERLEEGFDGPPTLEEIAARVGQSPHHLQRRFKRLMGVSPAQYADALRLGRLKGRLKAGDEVTGALYEAGYGASSRLYERAPAELGMTPASYARGGKGASIAFSTAASPLGRLLVAATARGIAFLALGDDDAGLESRLHDEFPEAEVRRDDAVLGSWLGQVLRHLEGELPHLALPLDVRATAFQRRVWAELVKIPAGATASYGEIAGRLGQPKAQRAVARACASNPVAVVVPCHRVVREDGGLGGYRWGLERKRHLLEAEAARAGA